jgi:uncharacterized repeat protein (TIGR01451 family)
MTAAGGRRSMFREMALGIGLLAAPVGILIAQAGAAPTPAAAAARAGSTAPPASRAAGASTRPPAAPAHAGPRLSISVSDGRTQVTAGDRVTYTVKLRNAGAAAVRRVTVTQTLPPGTRLISASGGETAAHGRITWHASVGAGRAATFTSSEQVVRIPARQLRLAAVACAALPGSARPVVCAAALTDTPATAEAVARSAQSGAPGRGSWAGYAAVGGAAVAVSALAVVLARRTRPRRRTRRLG